MLATVGLCAGTATMRLLPASAYGGPPVPAPNPAPVNSPVTPSATPTPVATTTPPASATTTASSNSPTPAASSPTPAAPGTATPTASSANPGAKPAVTVLPVHIYPARVFVYAPERPWFDSDPDANYSAPIAGLTPVAPPPAAMSKAFGRGNANARLAAANGSRVVEQPAYDYDPDLIGPDKGTFAPPETSLAAAGVSPLSRQAGGGAVPGTAAAGANGAAPGTAAGPNGAPGATPAVPGGKTAATKPKVTSGEKLLGPLGKDLNISGGWTLHGEEDSISGASQQYTDQNLSGLDYRSAGVGPLQQNMDMTIQGKLFNVLSVNAHLSNSRYQDSLSRTFGFDYKSKGTTVDAGTVSASLTGNQLVPFTRSVEGIEYTRDLGNKTTTEDFVSISKASTEHGSFQGQGTSGPYFLNASSIIPGSEHLDLDGKDLTSGKDYSIDYNLGQVTFLNGVIVNQTDTVTYSYEAQTYNTTPGILAGTRYATQEKNGDALGVTLIKQTAMGVSANKNGTVTQYFPVYGVAGSVGGVADLTYQYYLSAAINTNYPLTLKWQNETLTLNVDYVLNTELHYFQLKRELPADTSETGITSLSCTYTPVETESVAGDKQVYGLDTKLKVSPNASVGLTFAGSQADAPDQTGQGMVLTSDWHSLGKSKNNTWDVSTSLKDIGEDFSSIDSTSTAFLQAQRGLTTAIKYSPTPYYNLTTSLTDSTVATTSTVAATSTTAATTATAWAHNQSFNAGLNISIPHLPTLALTHTQTTQNAGGTSGNSTFVTDGLTSNWTKGIFGLTAAITNTQSTGQSIFSSAANNSVASTSTNTGTLIEQAISGTFSQTATAATALTSRVSLSVTPKPWISFNTDYGISRNRTGDSGSSLSGTETSLSTAHNYGFGVNMQPTHKIIITWNATYSDNGQSTAAFTNTATASAAAGTSSASQLVDNVTGQESRTNNLSIQYMPLSWLTTNFARSTSLELIPGSENTESNSTTYGLTGSPVKKFQIGIMATDQQVTYVGGEGNSNNTSQTVTSTLGPFGKMTFTTALMRMDYGSATYTTTSSSSTSGVGVITGVTGASTSTTTGLVQNGVSTTLSLQTDYSVGKNRSLFFRWRDLDQGAPSGSSTASDATVVGTTDSTYVSTNYRQSTATVGFEMRLSEFFGFTLNFNLVNMTDLDNPQYSYHAKTFTTDFSAKF